MKLCEPGEWKRRMLRQPEMGQKNTNESITFQISFAMWSVLSLSSLAIFNWRNTGSRNLGYRFLSMLKKSMPHIFYSFLKKEFIYVEV